MDGTSKLKLAIVRLLGRYPLHGAIVAQWCPTPDDGVPTMRVGLENAAVHLRYNPKFVEEISIDETMGVLCHEVNHCIGQHILMKRNDFPNKAALTIATEVTANEYVREPLPFSPILLEQFREILPPDEDAQTRYERLKDIPYHEEPVALDCHDWEEIQMNHELAELVFAGTCAAAVRSLTEEQRMRCNPADINRAEWGIREFQLKRNRVDWKKALRYFVGRELSRSPSFLRPPRRFPELLGIAPAFTWKNSKPHVLAVIDTSGSMTKGLLGEISGELEGMAKEYQVTVCECDDRIREVYPYRPVDKVHGRGGTDLRPPLKSTFLREQGADMVVYFTDGCGSAPAVPPCVPVVWCIPYGGRKPTVWGRLIAMRGGGNGA